VRSFSLQGLFLGLLTLEGAVIAPRQDTNQTFYGSPARRRAAVDAATNSAASSSAACSSAAAAGTAASSKEPGAFSGRRQRPRSGRSPPPEGWATAALNGTEPSPTEAQPLYDALLDAFGGADADALAYAFNEVNAVQ